LELYKKPSDDFRDVVFLYDAKALPCRFGRSTSQKLIFASGFDWQTHRWLATFPDMDDAVRSANSHHPSDASHSRSAFPAVFCAGHNHPEN